MKAHSNVALVTGSAGFIGYHVCRRLLQDGWTVIGVDALTDYYDVNLKLRRQTMLLQSAQFRAINEPIESRGTLERLFEDWRPDAVIHLAAQAGVRHSIEAPESYVQTNLIGTFRLLDAARAHAPQHLLMASTSSVYGANVTMPYSEKAKADTQMSFYAATKKANEVMAHSYAHLYELPTTMFRFFTVYGPWGRPDMALFKFTKAIFEGDPIHVYNHGKMMRDFTYVDDLVDGIVRLINIPPRRPDSEDDIQIGDSLSPVAPFRIINIGNSEPVPLMDFIYAIEASTGRVAEKVLMEMQPGDVPATWADTSLLKELTGAIPKTSVKDGVASFVNWYRDYYDC